MDICFIRFSSGFSVWCFPSLSHFVSGYGRDMSTSNFLGHALFHRLLEFQKTFGQPIALDCSNLFVGTAENRQDRLAKLDMSDIKQTNSHADS
jgi:hypothetical protein